MKFAAAVAAMSALPLAVMAFAASPSTAVSPSVTAAAITTPVRAGPDFGVAEEIVVTAPQPGAAASERAEQAPHGAPVG